MCAVNVGSSARVDAWTEEDQSATTSAPAAAEAEMPPVAIDDELGDPDDGQRSRATRQDDEPNIRRRIQPTAPSDGQPLQLSRTVLGFGHAALCQLL